MNVAGMGVSTVVPAEIAREQLRDRIGHERLGAGGRLLCERDLAKSLEVSVRSTAEALTGMAAEGLVVRHRGRGTFLTAKGSRWATASSTGTSTLGLLLHAGVGMSFDILKHVERLSATHAILPLVSYAGWDQTQELAALQMMQQQATSVVAFVPRPDPSALADFYATLPGAFTPHFVSLIREVSPEMDAITFDCQMAGRQAATRALDRGARDILFCGMDDGLAARQCIDGITEAMGTREAPCVFCPVSRPQAASALWTHVRSLDRPFEIIAKSLHEAIAVAAVLRAKGLRVPEDVAFTAFDFGGVQRFADFPLTLLVPPCEALAELLVKRMEDCAEGRACDPMHVSLMFRVEERAPGGEAETFAGDTGL